jgi:heme exporter protein C
MPKSHKLILLFGFLLLIHTVCSLWFIGVDQMQGEAYRIIYIHVPSAFTAFSASFLLLITSLLLIKNPLDEERLRQSRAIVEVGLMFTAITLATGSIWGRPIWGVWWTWDARLTTTLLLAILFGTWLMMYQSIEVGPGRSRSCAILGIMIAADVPIIYKSVTWWRTLHQPQTIIRPGGGSTMDGDMLALLLSGIAIVICFGLSLIAARARNLSMEDDLIAMSLEGDDHE